MGPLIDVVAGARPNFMKIAPIPRALDEGQGAGRSVLRYRLIHTGQHYDARTCPASFSRSWEFRSRTSTSRVAAVRRRRPAGSCYAYEIIVDGGQERPVPGGRRRDLDDGLRDYRAKKPCVPVAHVEAGHSLR